MRYIPVSRLDGHPTAIVVEVAPNRFYPIERTRNDAGMPVSKIRRPCADLESAIRVIGGIADRQPRDS
jgi:hypothetical protein